MSIECLTELRHRVGSSPPYFSLGSSLASLFYKMVIIFLILLTTQNQRGQDCR